MARQKKNESFAMKVLAVLLVGSVATAAHFCFAWSADGTLPKRELFMLQGMALITIGYMFLYSIAVLAVYVFPTKRERYRRLRESLPHRKPR